VAIDDLTMHHEQQGRQRDDRVLPEKAPVLGRVELEGTPRQGVPDELVLTKTSHHGPVDAVPARPDVHDADLGKVKDVALWGDMLEIRLDHSIPT